MGDGGSSDRSDSLARELVKRCYPAGAMVYGQRLAGDGGDSPIMTRRGTRNQITYGAGVAYAMDIGERSNPYRQ